MFLTDQQILNSVADLLKYSAASLPAYWTNIVTEQHAAAYNYMLGKLLNRGFLQSQILQWDQGPLLRAAAQHFFRDHRCRSHRLFQSAIPHAPRRAQGAGHSLAFGQRGLCAAWGHGR